MERKVNHLKSAVSVMFCGNAAGEIVATMVVYKAENCYDGWTKGGPNNMVYHSTSRGWSDQAAFELWFLNQFLQSISHHRGESVALIGDNLGTQLCQPLDVAVFRALKQH